MKINIFKNIKKSFSKKTNHISYRAKSGIIMAVSLFMTVSVFASPFTQTIFAADSGDSLVSAVKVQEISDGVGPFDADDKPGNDSSAGNKIVRSFDQIGYTLAYATALKTDKPIDSGYLMCSFTLPCDKTTAQWDTSQMAWMEDTKVTTNSDGSQTLTGKKLLKNTSSQNAIPGAGTLSAGVKVEGAANGTKIQPTFKLWMENNTDSEAKSVTADVVTVSAAPRLDVKVVNAPTVKGGGTGGTLGYYDLKTGKASETKADGYLHGRMMGFGIGIMMRGQSETKGKKGLEIPSGNISFDLELNEYLSTNDKTSLQSKTEYQPVLWDYDSANYDRTGKLGREMKAFGIYSNNVYSHSIPVATSSNSDDDWAKKTRILNNRSGDISMTKTGTNKYHVTISNYKFDTDNWIFPTVYPDATTETNTYPSDYFYFSSNMFQALLQFPDTGTDNTKNLYLEAETKNLSYKSVSGATSDDVDSSNNKYIYNTTLYPAGSFRKDIRNVTNASHWEQPDGKQMPGKAFKTSLVIGHSYDDPLKAIDVLFKFDTDGIEAKDQWVGQCYTSNNSNTADLGTTTWLYAAKKDGSGWTNENEMISTKEKSLIFYKSLDDLKAAGKTCVGVLYEGRNMNLRFSQYNDAAEIHYNLKMKATAKIGTTYGMVADACAWKENITFTRYGHDGENKPETSINADTNSYVKAEFKNGTLVPGTNAGGIYAGNTIMAVGYNTTLTKSINDKNTDGSTKTSYDLDNNERTVSYSIQPKIEADVSDGTTNLYVTDTLPKNLTYKDGSSSWGDSILAPEITSNNDGTTTLKWTLSNVNIGRSINPILFKCTIGKAGAADDVTNNQQITNTASIYGDLNKNGVINKALGNMSDVSFTVIKLSSTSVRKSTDTPKIDIGNNFSYDFSFVNNSQNALKNVRLYDVFPFNGDGRNTSFNGTYTLKKITADFSGASTALSSLSNLQATSTSQKNDYSSVSTYTGWNSIAGTKSGTTVTWTPPADTKAIGLKFNSGGNEVVKVKVEFASGSGQKEGNSYINDILQYADDQVQYVRSNRAVVQIRGNIKIKKVWNDDSNALKKRPDTVDVAVYQNGVKYKTVTLKSSENWSAKITDVPVYDSDGNKYKYTASDSAAHYIDTCKASDSDPLDLTLTNTYATHDVTLSKKVTGNYGDRSHAFTFNVRITNAVPNKTYSITGTNAKTFTTDASGNASVSVKLKSGESTVFKNLPEEAKYQISEAQEDYNASYAINGAAAVSGSTSPVTTIKENSSAIIYTNLKEGLLPTGVYNNKKTVALVCAGIIADLALMGYALKKHHEYLEKK